MIKRCIVTVLTPVCVFGMAMGTHAAGWTIEGGEWVYYMSDGSLATETFKKSGNNWFYLGEDGKLVLSSIIEDGDDYYYVNSEGAMVSSEWREVANEDQEDGEPDTWWYYLRSTGKAVRNSSGSGVKIVTLPTSTGNAKFIFDEEGHMMSGWIDESGAMITDDDSVLTGLYYAGTNEDGRLTTGWLKYEGDLGDSSYDDLDYDYYWFYFSSNGEKLTDQVKKINGYSYTFDENGVMRIAWNSATSSITATTSKYYTGTLENGSLQKNRWIRTEAPEEWGVDDEDEHWFYAGSSGYLVTGQAKKINSKWYIFDDNGVMLSGLVVLDSEKPGDANCIETLDSDEVSAADIYSINDGYLHYFSDDEENDGSMKTGASIKISLSDDDYSFGFNKSSGAAYTGVVSNRVYRNGILQQAGSDDRYAIVYGGQGDDLKLYLVNSSGTRQKAGKYYKAGNDEYYVVCSGSDSEGYEIDHFDTLEEAKAALSG